ncbi:MAG TPA: 6-pyruvoyl-tetrahydropterin synthase-related protein [Anaerolineae bacterium]|nr:6-pyruvoyl-tetrahydropterin synthase-related protein [Anaerolineae bacterium]
MSSLTLHHLWQRVRPQRPDPGPWLVLLFCLFAVLPLAGPDYFFDTHDGVHSVFFLTEFDAAIRDGVWYPGWGTDHALGYGYPSFVYYSPLAYYAAEAFHLLGAGMVASVKWVWALSTLGSGLAMFACGRALLGRQRALLAAVLYVYVPYHLANAYVRGDLREHAALAWLPLVLLAFYRLAERVTLRRIAAAGLAYGAVWMTHNVTALIFTPLLAAYVLFLLRRPPHPTSGPAQGRARLAQAGGALGGAVLGLGISAALLLPALLERGFISQEQWVGSGYDYRAHFVYPFQMLSGFWGYGAAGPGPVDQMSFQLGLVPTVLSMLALVGALCRRSRERAQTLFWAVATALLLFLMLPASQFLWDKVPIAGLVQFPWRLLGLAALTMSLLGALALPRQRSERAPVPALVLAAVASFASFSYTLPQYTPVPDAAEGPLLVLQFELEYPDMIGRTAWVQEPPKTSPLVSQYQSGGPLVTAHALAPGSEVEMIRAGGASDELTVRSAAGTALQFYTYYYPGWRVWVNGEPLPGSALRPEGPHGLLTIDLAAGEHHVLLRWGDTPLRSAGKAITLACLGSALLMLMLGRQSDGPRGRACSTELQARGAVWQRDSRLI